MSKIQFIGARAKAKAAAGHFRRLEPLFHDYAKTASDAIAYEEIDDVIEVSCNLAPLPHEASIIAGETAYQLRSALDVMTCDLARLSGATDTSQTYFPMARDKAYFENAKTHRKIAKLSPERQDRIRALKPYEDPDLIALNALANFDRHDDLLKATPSMKDASWALGGKDGGGPLRVDAWYRKPAPDETGKVAFMRIPKDSPVAWGHFKLDLDFLFTHEPIVGQPVIATLSRIGIRVSLLIEQIELAENV